MLMTQIDFNSSNRTTTTVRRHHFYLSLFKLFKQFSLLSYFPNLDWGCGPKTQHLSHMWDATGQLPSTQSPCFTFSITFIPYIFISKWDKSAVYFLLTQNISHLLFPYYCSFTSLCIAPNLKERWSYSVGEAGVWQDVMTWWRRKISEPTDLCSKSVYGPDHSRNYQAPRNHTIINVPE